MTTYKEAGVDIDLANKAVKKIATHARSTFNSNTLTNLGGFGGCYLFDKDKYKEPVLVSSTDGVGTKLKVAFITDNHDTIGQCLVNHCVNDILAVGARPMFFLDYFATGKLSVDVMESVVKGLSIGCKENGCSLIGGETAEMPDFYSEGEYDMSGTIVGVCDRSNLLPNRKTKSGDVLVALKSTGLHTNGYSLARKVLLDKYSHDKYFDELGTTIGEELLKIHKSYLPIADNILDKEWLHSISHITGGGLVENTERVIEDGQKIRIDWDSWEWLPIFELIMSEGDVPIDDMRRSFNLGLGLVFVVDPKHVDSLSSHLNNLQEDYSIIGEVY